MRVARRPPRAGRADRRAGRLQRRRPFDAADYTVWRDSAGTTVDPFTAGDANGDGLVDEVDLALWRARYGDRYVAYPLVVNDLGDADDGDIFNGVTTLREAINYSRDNPEHDRVEFDPALSGGVIDVGSTGGYYQIESRLTIDASMLPEGITLDAGGRTTGLHVNAFTVATPNDFDVTLVGLTIQGGVQRLPGGGGAVNMLSTGVLTLIDCELYDNTAQIGGAVYAKGPVRLEGVTIDGAGATARNFGLGGSAVYALGDVTLVDTHITNLTDPASLRGGGAVVAQNLQTLFSRPQPSITLVDSSITGAVSGGVAGAGDISLVRSTLDGGGYFGVWTTSPSNSVPVSVSLVDSTVRGFTSEFGFRDSWLLNNSDDLGGGVLARGDVSLVRSRVEANGVSRPDPSPYVTSGGVIARGRVELLDSHVDGNFGFKGGGVYAQGRDEFGARPGPEDVVVSVVGSSVSDNTVNTGGSAIYALGSVVVDQSSISGNTVTYEGPVGFFDAVGAVVVDAQQAFLGPGLSLTVTQSVIAGNTGPANTAAVYDHRLLTVTVTDSHVIDNDSDGAWADEVVDSIVARNTGTGVVAGSVSGSTVTGNGDGGIAGSEVEVYDSVVRGNTARSNDLHGAGVSGASSVLVVDSLIESNTSYTSLAAGGVGAGRLNAKGFVLLRSTIRDNTADHPRAWGAGVRADGNILLFDTTVSGNTSVGDDVRGAIWSSKGVSLYNSTVSGNRAIGDNAKGAGVSTYVLTVVHGTITDNHAIGQHATGGGAEAFNQYSFEGSLIAGNTATAGAPDLLGPNPGISQTGQVGNSLIEDPDGARLEDATVTNTLIGVDPLLGPLADNGGPTRTHALLPGSPAIDAGDPTRTDVASTIPFYGPYEGLHDQRGEPFARVVDGGLGAARIDLGAFEFQPVDPPPASVVVAPALTVLPTTRAYRAPARSIEATDAALADAALLLLFDDGLSAIESLEATL